MCSIGRTGGGARAAPVSATGRRAGGRFDVDRVRGHDKMHRDACSASRAGPHTPQWSRTTPREARAGVHLLLRLLPEPRCIGARGPHLRCASRGSARLFQPPSYCSGAERFRGSCLQTRSEDMDAIETATQTEPGVPREGIGTGRRRVGGKPEIQSSSEDELSVRCVDRVQEMRSGRGRRTGRGRGRGRGRGIRRAGK